MGWSPIIRQIESFRNRLSTDPAGAREQIQVFLVDPPGHVHRVKLKWGRALALARLGALPRAERLLVEVVERLIAAGLKDDARRALDALIWVVERTRVPGRTLYYELKYERLSL